MSDLKVCDVSGLAVYGSGPQWGEESEQLNITILSWENGRGVDPQINRELDVVIIVLQGEGEARVGERTIALRPGVVLPIAKGQTRSVVSTSERLTYASVHQRRPGLIPKFAGQ